MEREEEVMGVDGSLELREEGGVEAGYAQDLRLVSGDLCRSLLAFAAHLGLPPC